MEVIIADGQSTDTTRLVAQRYGAAVVENPARHAAGGRNRGAAIARGEWLAFTDSDCRPHPDWIESAVRSLASEPDLVALGGPIRPAAPRTLSEEVAGTALLQGVLQFSDSPHPLTRKGLRDALITANVFYRRDAFWSIGGFDERFANYGEDIDLLWRMMDRFPSRLWYTPDVVVEHSFPTTRPELFRKWFQYGIASCFLQRYHGARVHIDASHYRRLVSALGALLTNTDQRERQATHIVQLVGHLSGKVVGSARAGVVNL